MSSDFFVTKVRFLFFFLVFSPYRDKNKVLCTKSRAKFFIYAQHKQKVAQRDSFFFGQDNDFINLNPRIREDVLRGSDV